ncbi:MAG: hypothetical protein JST04_08555 [Bdellovibrionales bacterium]|nr:hypothetical protein [Bdellovibrionales bacterium]
MKKLASLVLFLCAFSSVAAHADLKACRTYYTLAWKTSLMAEQNGGIAEGSMYLSQTMAAMSICSDYYLSTGDKSASGLLTNGALFCTGRNNQNSELANATCRMKVLRMVGDADGLANINY